MTREEFLSTLDSQKIDLKIVEDIEHKYGFEIPEIVQKIISASVESVFFDDDWRTLSVDEILDASEDLHVDFEGQMLLPIVDTGENDFIVYHAEDDTWSKFNIIEECHFKVRKSFYEYF